MGYTIELSFDIRKRGDITETCKIFEKESSKYGCELFYTNYEVSGYNRTMRRCHYVMTFIFEENDEIVAKFVKFVKQQRDIKIESVVCENSNINIMYASKQYLNMMEKEFAKRYCHERRNGLLYNMESPIMKAVYAKN